MSINPRTETFRIESFDSYKFRTPLPELIVSCVLAFMAIEKTGPVHHHRDICLTIGLTYESTSEACLATWCFLLPQC